MKMDWMALLVLEANLDNKEKQVFIDDDFCLDGNLWIFKVKSVDIGVAQSREGNGLHQKDSMGVKKKMIKLKSKERKMGVKKKIGGMIE